MNSINFSIRRPSDHLAFKLIYWGEVPSLSLSEMGGIRRMEISLVRSDIPWGSGSVATISQLDSTPVLRETATIKHQTCFFLNCYFIKPINGRYGCWNQRTIVVNQIFGYVRLLFLVLSIAVMISTDTEGYDSQNTCCDVNGGQRLISTNLHTHILS